MTGRSARPAPLTTGAGHGGHHTHRTGRGCGVRIHRPPYPIAGERQPPVPPDLRFPVRPCAFLPGRFGARTGTAVSGTGSDTGSDRRRPAGTPRLRTVLR